MKKLITLLLVFVMSLSLCGCGKSKAVANVETLISAIGDVSLDSGAAISSAQNAFDALTPDEQSDVENYAILVDSQATFQKMESERILEEQEKAKFDCGKEAFDHIKAAWEITDRIGGDILSVWSGSISKTQDMIDKGINFFVDETTLTLDEVIEGLASLCYANMEFSETGILWVDLSEDTKQEYRDYAVDLTEKASRYGTYMVTRDALLSIVNAYTQNGQIIEAQESIEAAKLALKKLSGMDGDCAYFPDLNEFHTTASALLDFCMSPSGDLEQYEVLLNDYRKEAQTCINDLDSVFE